MANNTGFGIALDFLRTLALRKRFILFATFVPTVLSIVVVLLSQSIYRSEALINPPKNDGGGSLAALQGIDGEMGGLLGSFLGGGEMGLNDCISILQSTQFAQLVIDRFDLETSYQFKKPGRPAKYFKADVVKMFRKMAPFETTEEGAIRMSINDTSAVRAQEMLAYMIYALDSIYTDIQKVATIQRLRYVDERLFTAESEMRRLEDSLVAFKNRHNLLAPEAQIRAVLQNATQTELRLETVKEELALEAAMRGTSSAKYQDLAMQKNLLEKTLSGQIRSRADTNSLLLPTRTLPALATEYFRLERAYLVRLGVYKFLIQQAETLKLDADKNIRVISVLDPPWVNDKRVSPRRRMVVQSVFALSLVFSVFLVILFEAWKRHGMRHPESVRLASEVRQSLLRF